MKRTTLGLGCAILLVFAAVGIASATSRSSRATTPAGAARLSVLARPFHATRAQRAERAEIKREFRRAPRGAAVAAAAFDSARAVTIAGTSADAWIAPDADGGICTFIPDPLGGYGSACASADAVAAGEAITALLVGDGAPLAGRALVVVPESDGAPGPLVRSLDGSIRQLPVDSNVASGVITPGDTIVAGGQELVIPSAKHGSCAAPAPGDEFRRC